MFCSVLRFYNLTEGQVIKEFEEGAGFGSGLGDTEGGVWGVTRGLRAGVGARVGAEWAETGALWTEKG